MWRPKEGTEHPGLRARLQVPGSKDEDGMSKSAPREGTGRTVGILAYGSLIDDPGEKIRRLTVKEKGPVLTPFKVEFARKSGTRGNAPTLVPVEDGGAPVQAKILVLDTSQEEAANRLYCRETRNPDPDCVYTAPKNPGPNHVVVERIEDFEGVDVVLYTSIGANIEPLTAAELARLAIGSVRNAKPGLDGISYLIAAKRNGITTALSEDYEEMVLRQLEVPTLDEALAKLRGQTSVKG